MAEVPQAHLVSAIPGRIRLRLPAHRGDHAFFAALAAQLAEMPAIRSTRANAATAGLLVLHTGALDELLRTAERRRLFQLAEPAPARTAGPAGRQWPIFAAAGMAGLGCLQLVRGQALPPALTLFWNAATLIAMRRNS